MPDLMFSAEFTVDSAAILREAAEHINATDPGGAGVGVAMGLNEIRRGLARLSIRAIELRDDTLITELVRLGCIHLQPKTNSGVTK